MTDLEHPHEAYDIHGANRPGRWLITCDHACNHVPQWVGPLGIDAQDMARHIAYDIGVKGTALALADLLDCPVICTRFSRLVIDPNRGEDDPTLIMRLYDGTIIAGNRHLSDTERHERLERLYRPYHAAYETLAQNRKIVALHSFTPCLQGRQARPWHIGILHAPPQESLSLALIALLRQESDLCIGDNEPYTGHLPGDSIDQHALQQGRPNTLIELRQDLIERPEQQHIWAGRLAPLLERAAAAIS